MTLHYMCMLKKVMCVKHRLQWKFIASLLVQKINWCKSMGFWVSTMFCHHRNHLSPSIGFKKDYQFVIQVVRLHFVIIMEIWYTALETPSGSFSFVLYKYVWLLYIYIKFATMCVYGIQMLCLFLELLYLFLVILILNLELPLCILIHLSSFPFRNIFYQ